MKDFIRKVLYPNKILAFLLFNFSVFLLIYVFTNGLEKSIVAYCFYPVAFYSLIFFCIWMYDVIKLISKKVNENKLYGKYKGNIDIKIKSSLYFNIFMNIIYGIFNLVFGILYNSVWLITFAVYYIILSIMRIILLININSKESRLNREYKILKSCGIVLLFMNMVFSGIITLIIIQNRFFSYPGYLIYVVAMYDFYLIISAIYNVIKFRKNTRPLFSASKYINLTVAMISMLSLETAMLEQFGLEGSGDFNHIMIGSTGVGICIINSVMSIFMISKANKNT